MKSLSVRPSILWVQISELHPAPRQMDIRVVPFRFRHFPQPHRKIEGAPEVGKGVLLLEVMLSHHFPSRA